MRLVTKDGMHVVMELALDMDQRVQARAVRVMLDGAYGHDISGGVYWRHPFLDSD